MQKDNPNLDLLRAVAVSLVFFAHLVMVFGHLDAPIMKDIALRKLAELGVLIFFVHTSLVLMMSLDRLGSVNVIQRFYVRRAFRIYPLAMIAVLLVVALRIPPHFEPIYEEPSVAIVVQNLFLVQNLFRSPDILGPMWSLPLEVQMYILLPFIYFAAKRVESYVGIFALILCGFVLWYVDSHIARGWGSPALFPYAPWFFMGVAAYIGYKIVKPVVGGRYYGLALILLILVPPLAQRFIGDYRVGWASWGSGVLFALAMPYCLGIRSKVLRRCTHVIATYSYSIYLSHVPIMWFSFQQLSSHPFWLQMGVFIVAMIMVPVALYHVVEAPLIRFGSRVADYMARPVHPAAIAAKQDLAR